MTARRLPASAALTNHDTDSSDAVSESRTPRLHMAVAIPASAALLSCASAAGRSAGIPSPTMSMYPSEDAAWASPRSEASERSSAAFAESFSTPSPSRYLLPSSLRDAASLPSFMHRRMAYSLITGPIAPAGVPVGMCQTPPRSSSGGLIWAGPPGHRRRPSLSSCHWSPRRSACLCAPRASPTRPSPSGRRRPRSTSAWWTRRRGASAS